MLGSSNLLGAVAVILRIKIAALEKRRFYAWYRTAAEQNLWIGQIYLFRNL